MFRRPPRSHRPDTLFPYATLPRSPPVRYDDGRAPAVDRDRIDDLVTGALIATRPDPSGRFPVPDFEILPRNLEPAYPASAVAPRPFLHEMPARHKPTSRPKHDGKRLELGRRGIIRVRHGGWR